ncbi:hypothetical protein HD554DRAFT_302113 [Boletus coccyginus]|nr:hypothetical protein HD554DRAFT_302113 [Boletus coccyginus]
MDFRLGTLALLIPTWGQFDVLFNICKNSDNTLHGRRGVPENFHPILLRGEVKSSDSAISPGPIHSHGIQQILQPSKPRLADYEFQVDSSTSAGAILILPHGAISKELLSPQQFREVASGSALDWYEFARKCYGVEHLDYPLYLITGFYKARSWSLGSFNNPTGVTGKILAQSNVEKNPNIYLLTSEFPADRRHGGGDDNNQAVFISGFKITVKRWLPDPMVQMATESETTWFILLHLLKACLNRLRSLSGAHKQRAAISVEHSPQLSQPFHPSDIINHFLLSKNPNARVAVTHDNQWMDMMKKGLTHEDLLQDDRLGAFLTRCYTISVDSECENTAVFLRGG